MAWHLLEVLREKEEKVDGSSDNTNNNELATAQLPPMRVRFTEITAKAIVNSIENPEMSLRDNLVQAQETRRILDRLAGFTVSPILWKKIAPGLSAGRVQSVGMALIVQRERERLLFQETEYWDLEADFFHLDTPFVGQLVSIKGTQLASGGSDFDPRQANTLTESSSHKLHVKSDDAHALSDRLKNEEWTWTVANVTATQRKLNPSPPFITSTLQQEANKRLALSVSRTMQTAQQLYENGYISYMRTDSNHLSDDAKQAIKNEIVKDFGSDFYQPITAKPKRKKKKDADKPDPQAAHEAIRPAIQSDGGFTKPNDLPAKFDGAAKELYELIYQRTVASHMPPQVSNQTSIRILGENDEDETSLLFRTSGSVVIKPGFTNVYPKQAEKDSPPLPSVQEGQRIDCDKASPLSHVTQPPPRFTEASFVQELEALGVGRPSTYAGTVQILRDRAYVGSPVTGDAPPRPGKGKVVTGPAVVARRAAGGEEFTGANNARGPMVPSLSAFVVCSLFEKHCNVYVDPSFTASMEDRLDKIANREEKVSEDERVAYLDEFYAGDDGLAAQIRRIDESVDADDARRARLPALEGNSTSDSEIGLFVGPWGPYIKKITTGDSRDSMEEGDKKPVTANLPPGMAADLSTITLQSLNGVLALKEENGAILGQHPEDGRNIRLKVGRFGAFLQWGDDGEEGTTTHTLPSRLRNMKSMDVANSAADGNSFQGMLGISFEEAVQFVNLPRTVSVFNELPIIASLGPYGPYLKYNNTFLNLKPADGDVLTIDSETAEALVTEGIINRKSSEY
jgi:DNA topoisomerase-1